MTANLHSLRVLVCGGRTYSDRAAVFRALDGVHRWRGPISFLIHGSALGADFLAGAWADARAVMSMPFPAEWRKHGKAAGPIRNQKMLDDGRPDLVVAFPGGAGTADMVRRAKASGVEVIEVGGHVSDQPRAAPSTTTTSETKK